MRNKSHKVLLDTGATGTTKGEAIQCSDAYARSLFLSCSFTVTAASLAGALRFYGSAEPVDNIAVANLTVLTSPVRVSPEIPEGAVYADGVITFGAESEYIPVGTTRMNLLIVDPPPFVVPVFAFTSGGGVRRIRVKAVY